MFLWLVKLENDDKKCKPSKNIIATRRPNLESKTRLNNNWEPHIAKLAQDDTPLKAYSNNNDGYFDSKSICK